MFCRVPHWGFKQQFLVFNKNQNFQNILIFVRVTKQDLSPWKRSCHEPAEGFRFKTSFQIVEEQ